MRDNPLAKFGVAGVVTVFSRRGDGSMSLNCVAWQEALNNRRKFLSVLGINYRDLVCTKQVHGKKVINVGQKDKGSGALTYARAFEDADGFVTAEKNLPLAIFTADCLSIFLYDPRKPAIGLLHAGWRGTEQNIAQAGVSELVKNFGSHPDDLRVGFGPGIRVCCFEVEENFKTNFEFGLIKRDGHTFMDLALVNSKQLLDCGVKKENIFDPEYCTFSQSDEFFSFRKEGVKAGRLISVAMLK